MNQGGLLGQLPANSNDSSVSWPNSVATPSPAHLQFLPNFSVHSAASLGPSSPRPTAASVWPVRLSSSSHVVREPALANQRRCWLNASHGYSFAAQRRTSAPIRSFALRFLGAATLPIASSYPQGSRLGRSAPPRPARDKPARAAEERSGPLRGPPPSSPASLARSQEARERRRPQTARPVAVPPVGRPPWPTETATRIWPCGPHSNRW